MSYRIEVERVDFLNTSRSQYVKTSWENFKQKVFLDGHFSGLPGVIIYEALTMYHDGKKHVLSAIVTTVSYQLMADEPVDQWIVVTSYSVRVKSAYMNETIPPDEKS